MKTPSSRAVGPWMRIGCILGMCLNPSARAAFVFSGAPAALIPDNSAVGVAAGFAFDNAAFYSIENVTVSLSFSGGYNGDLYCYLSHGSGFSVLLNRTGADGSNPYGYSDSGMNITLSSGNPDVHTYRTTLGGPPSGGVLTGTWGADGRINYTDTARNNTLDVFNGMDPNGNWTLFFADRAPGSTATIDSWSVSIEAVPEPVNTALMVFAGIGGGMALTRRLRRHHAGSSVNQD